MSWQQVRGHDALIDAFDRVVRGSRLGHAYLFVGPPGVGKRRFAQELAKALLCEDPPPGRLEACDHCPACLQVEAGTHPDFFVVGREEDSVELKIRVVRGLCERFSLKSARGHGKVAIVDDADDLSDEAANAFLKTLEEPPPRSVLILIGTSAERQLPTIVSRCQVVRFAPLPEDLVVELLRSEGVEDPDRARRLARLGGGSPGQARALADPALWDFRRSLLDRLTAPPIDRVALGKAWTDFVEQSGKEGGGQRRRAALALRLLIEFLRDTLAAELGHRPNLEGPDELRALETLRKRLDPERLLQLLERCLEADHQIDRRVQLVLVLEALGDALGALAA